ncbi:MAG: enolase C-terminal domain-like protein [Thermoguttaceae bacterium]
MKISKIDAYLVRIPLKKHHHIASEAHGSLETVIVRMCDADGNSGWGEVFPGNLPTLTSAWSGGTFHTLVNCVIPCFEDELIVNSGAQLQEKMAKIQGNRHAKGSLDLAFWDLTAKRLGKPVYEAIGGKKKDVEVGLTFDRYDAVEPFLEDIQRAVSEGYKRITLKIRPGWDLQIVGFVRSDFPMIKLQCDLECALNLEKHSEIIRRFDDFFPSLLEQPLSSSEFVGHAMLQDSMRTSICLDESITTLDQTQIALDLRSCSTICIKPGRVAGFTDAKLIHDSCITSDVDCYSGSDGMSSIGYRFTAALSALPQFKLPADYFRFDEIFADDPGEQLKPVLKPDENGKERMVLELWDSPGIGFEPDVELVEKLAINKFSKEFK